MDAHLHMESLGHSRDLKQIQYIIYPIKDMLCVETHTVLYKHIYTLLQGQVYDIIPSHSV